VWARYRKLLFALPLLALPFVFFYVNAKEPRDLNVFDEVVLRISGPIQEATRWVVDGVADLWEDYVYLRDQRTENARLRARSRKLRELEARLAETEKENARLRALLAFHARTPEVRKISARVIARSTSPYFRVQRIRIDAGASARVVQGMPVVTADGVVGQVRRVYGPYADVQLLADPASSIDVVVQGTRATGFLRGRGEANNYRCRLEYLSLPDLVREGDLVVTSGVGAGNRLPPGLPVGKVSHVVRKQFAVAQEVEVTPAVDFGKVEEVFVLATPGAQVPAGSREVPPPPRAPGAGRGGEEGSR
jgi:rod shape-determining protein MreC